MVSRENRLPPFLVLDIPLHRRRQTYRKVVRRRPPRVHPELGGIERVPPVMARTVADVPDTAEILTQVPQNSLDDLAVVETDAGTDVVDLAHRPSLEHRQQCAAMVVHMNPIP